MARAVFEWVDGAGGFLRTTSWNNGSGALLTAYEIAASLLSNAGLQFVTSATPDIAVSTANPGHTWWLTTDTAVFNFTTVAGTTVQVTIPGPDQSIFLPDGLTIDTGNLLVIAFAAAAGLSLTDSAGNAVSFLASGVKSSRRTEQNAPPS